MSEFRKSLTLLDSTAIVMGSMIGSGIFIVSSDIARQLGSPGWLLLIWLITGIMTIIAAMSYGELASLFPKAGGQYIYLREAYNPLFGFLYGWTFFLVIQTGTIAAVGMAFAKFTGVIVPCVSENNTWFHMGLIRLNTVHIVAIASIVFLTFTNSRGIKTGKYVQNSFTIVKALLVVLFIFIGFLFAKDTGAIELNRKVFWNAAINTHNGFMPLTGFALIAAIGTAMVGSLFSSDAWNNITFAGEEIINPKRNIALSLFLGTLTVTILYVLVNIVYMQVLPLRGNPQGSTFFERGIQYAANDRLGTAAITGIFGEYAAVIMAGFIIFSTFGCNNGLILSGARVYYAMSQHGLFFKFVGRLNSKSVPAAGLTVQCIWSCLLCLTGTYSQLLDYVIFAVLIFYVLTISGIFILRLKLPDAERKYKAFGYPVLPTIYIILACLIMYILLIYKPDYTLPGLIIVILGIPVYYIWTKINSKF